MIAIRSDANYLSNFPFGSMEELEKYLDSSFTSFYFLMNEKLFESFPVENPGLRISMDHVASHLGKAHGLSIILRGIRHNAAHQRCYVPNDILSQTNCSHEDFLRGTSNERVSNAIFEMASHAHIHLTHAIDMIHNLPTDRQNKQIYLPFVAVQSYLNRLRKVHFDVYHPSLYRKNGLLPLKCWWKAKFL